MIKRAPSQPISRNVIARQINQHLRQRLPNVGAGVRVAAVMVVGSGFTFTRASILPLARGFALRGFGCGGLFILNAYN